MAIKIGDYVKFTEKTFNDILNLGINPIFLTRKTMVLKTRDMNGMYIAECSDGELYYFWEKDSVTLVYQLEFTWK